MSRDRPGSVVLEMASRYHKLADADLEFKKACIRGDEVTLFGHRVRVSIDWQQTPPEIIELARRVARELPEQRLA